MMFIVLIFIQHNIQRDHMEAEIVPNNHSLLQKPQDPTATVGSPP
jgi:hypothetical protein